MSRKFIKFFFLIFVLQIVNTKNYDELFGDKSIIRKLRDNHGSFQTELNLKNGPIVNEKYDFKSKNGLVIPRVYRFKIWKYSNDFEKFFSIYAGTCDNEIDDNIMRSLLEKWSSPKVIQIPFKFKMLGPSNLLFSLINNYDDNKENVYCENLTNNRTRCDVIFGYKDKVEYHFRNTNDLKMYPIKINLLRKYSRKFESYEEIKFIKFDYSFNGDFQVDFKIPIGYSCKPKDIDNKNPKIGTDLGENFELEYDAVLEYLDLETKDKMVFLKTEFKSQKWSMNKKNSLNFLDGIDKTNKSIRTFLIDEIKSVYEFHNNKCIKYNNFENGENVEWINQLHDIKLFPDFFFINDKNSVWYLDDYKLNNKIYNVFEKEQNNHPKRRGPWYDGRKPYYNVVTHYYSKSNDKIPELIVVRTKGLLGEPLLATLKIKIKKHILLSDNLNQINLKQFFGN